MESEPRKPVDDPRVFLAAERTYLAWVRTSLGLMGFGFLIARFGYLIRSLEASDPTFDRLPAHRSPFAPVLGAAIVAFGVAVCVTAALRHRAYVEDLRAGVGNPDLHLRTTLVVAAVLAISGLAMTMMILTS